MATGTRLGPYTVSARLGQGGMGAVYRAKDGAGREVAVKVLATDLAQDARYVERFRREGLVAESVVHRNVVACLGNGEEGGKLWIAFELVSGGTLKDLVRTRGKLPWRDAARLGAQIARGLAAIHAKGLVHRDVKPANVLLDAAGLPKVSDLGLARGLANARTLTLTGELVGTFEYVAPEQTEHAKVDFRADLYSFGALLYELLTGRPPFAGAGMALIAQHISAVATPPRELVPGIPDALDALVRRLLAKQPEARGESALAVALELDGLGGAAAGRSRGPLVAASLVGAGALVAGLAWAARPASPAPPSPSPPPPPAVAPIDTLLAGAPAWFRATPAERRPRLPLPSPVRIGESDGEYLVGDGAVTERLVYVPELTVDVPDLKSGAWLPENPELGRRSVKPSFHVGPLFLGKFEVRNADFEAFVAATGWQTEAEKTGGHYRTGAVAGDGFASAWGLPNTMATWRTPVAALASHVSSAPVVQVVPSDALAYARWVSPLLRLPSVGEWQGAAAWRHGSAGSVVVADRLPAGVQDVSSFARALAPCGTNRDDGTVLGAHDMAGNACEWVSESIEFDGQDRHLLCGGAWYLGDGHGTKIQLDYRATSGFGFRVALSAPRRAP